jgi:hypothetical protein
MANLLTVAEVQKVRRISTTWATGGQLERFNAFALEAQDVHLRQFLGDALYLDLITNPTEAANAKLLTGETYENAAGEDVKYFGLYTFLSYAWLFINAVEGDDFQANIGTVNFENAGRTIQPKAKSYTLKKYQDSMTIYRNNAIDYLNEKASDFPLWKGNKKLKRGKYRIQAL